MTLGEFKKHIESFRNGTVFDYGISEPFSWRGIYSEVAFCISSQKTTKEDILERINNALTETFEGYKGGDYRYNEHTDIHFESEISSYTDGGYCSQWIERITEESEYYTQEQKLVNLMFKTT